MNDAWVQKARTLYSYSSTPPSICPSLVTHWSPGVPYLPFPPTAHTHTPPCPKVKKHSSVGDLWMVIRGRVYDFTAFLQGEAGGHPGGAEILAAYAGADGASQHI